MMCHTVTMQLRKYRWSRDYESAEEELERMLKMRKFQAERWATDPGEDVTEQENKSDKTLWCAEGSIVFTVHDSTTEPARRQLFSLQPGDALDLPANTTFSALAGMTGAVCYESRSKIQ